MEDPASPVRAIVSVDKLKEGWDVRNIGVIVGLRALASQTLTEQILGRGLRLPFGERTDVAAIDQVDVVAHELYQELLRNKDALIQRIQAVATAGLPEGASPLELDFAEPVPGAVEPEDGFALVAVSTGEPGDGALGALAPADILLANSVENVEQQLDRDRATVNRVLAVAPDAPRIVFPRSERQVSPVVFSLEELDLASVEQAGHLYAKNPTVQLIRRSLLAERDLIGGLSVRDEAGESAEASQVFLPIADVRDDLFRRLTGLPLVQATLTERSHAHNVIDAFLRGAGVVAGDEANWTDRRARQAEDALTALVRGAYQRHGRQPSYRWNPVTLPIGRREPSDISPRWKGYVKGAWSDGWDHSVERAASFDSEHGEWTFAMLIDESSTVRWWLRLYQLGEAWIHWRGGRYFPDFIVIDSDATRWLVEVKSDRWRYLLVTESDIDAAPNWENLVG